MLTADRIIHAIFLLIAAGLVTYAPDRLSVGGF